MIEHEKFIYLDVYRTGSTFLISAFRQITSTAPVREFRHASLTKGFQFYAHGGKLVIATVRNPWDWYVSLWAYGADGKSAIRKYLAKHLPAPELARLYDTSAPQQAFRRWLALMHDPKLLDAVMGEHYPESGLSDVIGLYSYRFLRVTTPYPRVLLRKWRIATVKDAIAYQRSWKTYDVLLRSETLNQELQQLIASHGARCGFKPDAAKIANRLLAQHTNASGRTLASYREYYDDASRDLVARRDQLFDAAFGYRF